MGLDREWMRGAAPLAVMTLLESGDMYGYELVEALERRSRGILALGQSTVYPLLYNLEGRGQVESFWRNATSGRKRKYYRLTPAGLSWLKKQRSQWHSLVTAMVALGVSHPEVGE